MPLLPRAVASAAHWHKEQLDKNGEPYILHPLRVMFAVRQAGYSEEHQVAAVLHDVLEDTEVPFTDLTFCGKGVCTAIGALTRSLKTKEPYAEYFERCAQNPLARVVKYYDLLDNLDPRRYHPEAPYSRYLKSLAWFKENWATQPQP